jgi:hypothetical protein
LFCGGTLFRHSIFSSFFFLLQDTLNLNHENENDHPASLAQATSMAASAFPHSNMVTQLHGVLNQRERELQDTMTKLVQLEMTRDLLTNEIARMTAETSSRCDPELAYSII